jgi:hypothetical protein
LIPDKVKPKAEQGMPGAFMEEKQPVVVEQTEEEADRTCNCCVKGRTCLSRHPVPC